VYDTLIWVYKDSGGDMNLFKQFISVVVMALLTAAVSAVAIRSEVRSGANRGWVYSGEDAYYFDEHGDEYSGLKIIPDDGTLRFFDPETHIMVKGETVIDGSRFYFNEDGILTTGFCIVNGNTRYYDTDTGILKTGWLEENSRTYYLDDNTGDMITGWKEIGGSRYFFAEDGTLTKGSFEADGNKYRTDPESGILVTGLTGIGDKNYFFDPDTGVMKTGWVEIEGDRYYFDKENGAGYDGILDIDGSVYGFAGGLMLVNQRAISDNHLYYFGEDGSVIREVDGNQPMIAITYDDGPSIYTDSIIDTFEEYGQKCTFFIVGDRISWNEEEAAREAELGYEQGNHTYGHNRLTDLDADEVKEVLKWTDDELIRVTGKPSTCLRPPEGRWNETVKDVCEAPVILWCVDSEDWKSRNSDTICSRIIGKVRDGDIVLMHDLYQATADATKRIVPALVEAGYQLVTIEEMGLLKLDGGLEDGVVYYSIPNR